MGGKDAVRVRSMTPERLAKRRDYDSRRAAEQPWRRLYKTVRWIRMRVRKLKLNPLCEPCMEAGRCSLATVVDHKVAHKGDRALFFDETNLESQCSTCHDRHKQREEINGFHGRVDDDGWPADPRHPANADPGGVQSLGPSRRGPARGLSHAAPHNREGGSK